MTLTRLLTAASFAAVMAAGAAYAQDTSAVDANGNVVETPVAVDPNTGAVSDTSATTDRNDGTLMGTPAPVGSMSTDVTSATSVGVPASSMTTSYTGAPGTVTTRTITNGPVPDTPENRAKYGQPMSHAGKRTAPAGN